MFSTFQCFSLEPYPDEPSPFHLPEQLHFLRGDKSCRFSVESHSGREIEFLTDTADYILITGAPDDGELDAVTLHVC